MFFASIFLNWNQYKKRFKETKTTIDKLMNLSLTIFALLVMVVGVISVLLFCDTVIYVVKSNLSGDMNIPQNYKSQGQVGLFLASFFLMTWCLLIRILTNNQFKENQKGFDLVIALNAIGFFGMMHFLNYDFIKICTVIISTIQRYI
ncbi:MAG: hypothetical protein GF353_11815 [Candidatus Lokiarchaeota archaeon]|nr:hypothetical protein [Candidatus Lokiarchaeota archaeon]